MKLLVSLLIILLVSGSVVYAAGPEYTGKGLEKSWTIESGSDYVVYMAYSMSYKLGNDIQGSLSRGVIGVFQPPSKGKTIELRLLDGILFRCSSAEEAKAKYLELDQQAKDNGWLVTNRVPLN